MREDRRRHGRLVVPEDKLLACEGVSRTLRGQISVLGLGGMYIRTTDMYPAGTEVELRIRSGAETIETPCVVRDVVPGGLGVEFTWVRGSLEQKLQRLMAQIKP